MRIIHDDIRLCVDCLMVAESDGAEHIDQYYGRGPHPGRGELRDGARERMAIISAGLAKLGPHLVAAYDSETGEGIDEFSSWPCDCCDSRLAGSRHKFAILGD